MKTVSASKFKEQCLALLEQVSPEGIVITKHGKPVARLVPVEAGCKHLIGSMKGNIRVHGDIMSTGRTWHAQS
ncbi:MAG: type II toxin-antitoxin system Phd/YefM family antitoxin [Terriglobales bacterium]